MLMVRRTSPTCCVHLAPRVITLGMVPPWKLSKLLLMVQFWKLSKLLLAKTLLLRKLKTTHLWGLRLPSLLLKPLILNVQPCHAAALTG
jgi:hypothetical protein